MPNSHHPIFCLPHMILCRYPAVMKKTLVAAACVVLMLGLATGCKKLATTPDEVTGSVGIEPKANYDFRLVAVEADKDHIAMGRFAFRHRQSKPIQLYGFGFTGTNVFETRFEKFQREDDGKWSKLDVGYCGTAAQFYPIEPNKDYVFLVPLWPFAEKGQKGLVGVLGTNVVVWSIPFDTAEIKRIGEAARRSATSQPPVP